METRAQSGGSSGPPDGGDGGEEAREAPVLLLHQIRTVHVSNEYTEGPVAISARSRTPDLRPSGPTMDEGMMQDGSWTLSSGNSGEVVDSQDFQDSGHSRDVQTRDLHDSRDSSHGPHGPHSAQSPASRSTSGTSEGSYSNSSEQRLLGNASRAAVEQVQVVQAQPKRSEAKKEELKPLTVSAGSGKQHSDRCDRCRRCKCEECRSPRSLPACWLCGRRCLCSAESAVDYMTCACCLKGMFYHCSTDDEDVCADKPFSCQQPNCCVRWSAAGALALILPCLLCYLPARGCLALCQACHDRAHRPGCRCQDAGDSLCKDST
ncbi:protein sprouty homolog 2-like [Astyanax mexicanus]|uniref:protein sprouty homolog 2-like n=1 Tax=Astyanax mexicanus TaxID=7994 RepID=UPI0020CB63F0|nr:protein sprouty homolog 2-like [Astyanax mexicanus]